MELSFQKDGINFFIKIIINQNSLYIQGKTNINNNNYILTLNLQNLHTNEFFQRCNSLNEVCDLLQMCNKSNYLYIKEINNSEIIMALKTKKGDILFNLDSNQNNYNFYNNNNNNNNQNCQNNNLNYQGGNQNFINNNQNYQYGNQNFQGGVNQYFQGCNKNFLNNNINFQGGNQNFLNNNRNNNLNPQFCNQNYQNNNQNFQGSNQNYQNNNLNYQNNNQNYQNNNINFQGDNHNYQNNNRNYQNNNLNYQNNNQNYQNNNQNYQNNHQNYQNNHQNYQNSNQKYQNNNQNYQNNNQNYQNNNQNYQNNNQNYQNNNRNFQGNNQNFQNINQNFQGGNQNILNINNNPLNNNFNQQNIQTNNLNNNNVDDLNYNIYNKNNNNFSNNGNNNNNNFQNNNNFGAINLKFNNYTKDMINDNLNGKNNNSNEIQNNINETPNNNIINNKNGNQNNINNNIQNNNNYIYGGDGNQNNINNNKNLNKNIYCNNEIQNNNINHDYNKNQNNIINNNNNNNNNNLNYNCINDEKITNISNIINANNNLNINDNNNNNQNIPIINPENNLNINNKDNEIQNNDNFPIINLEILQAEKNNYFQDNNISGILKLLLMKKLFYSMKNIKNIEYEINNNLKDIFITFKNKINLFGEANIKPLIEENKIVNIYLYSQYLSIINPKEIIILINKYLNKEEKENIENYWKTLSKYTIYNSFFESTFIEHLKKSKFDYSLININIIKREDSENYVHNENAFANREKKIVYYISNKNNNNMKIIDKLEYFKELNYGKGFYFTDNLDYISFLPEYENQKIIPVNNIFSCIVSEIFYDKNKIKYIQNESKDLKVETNGVNIVKNELNKNLLNSESLKNENYLGNKYIISEKNQILPIYSLTLKRNEYCVLWRDPNFSDINLNNKYLVGLKEYYIGKTHMNFYYESSTEEALKFILRRKYDKVIIITSIGKDLSGKRFVEIARKIYGFDIIVLFFSNNQIHLKWIETFPNCLYTSIFDIFEEYITNFNESGLKKLKTKVENTYKIKLKNFSFDFILFPNYKSEGDFHYLDFNSHYIRHVYIKNGDKYLCMKINGEVFMSQNKCTWDITILNNEITLFSNGFYLDLHKNDINMQKTVGFLYMIVWNFEKENDFYYFINPNKKSFNILSIEGDDVLVNKNKVGDNEIFQLIDALDE